MSILNLFAYTAVCGMKPYVIKIVRGGKLEMMWWKKGLRLTFKNLFDNEFTICTVEKMLIYLSKGKQIHVTFMF